MIDSLRTAQESGLDKYPELKGIPNLTNNHIALWECICSRTHENGTYSKAVIRDDMRLKGFDVDKKFSRWSGKLEDAGGVFVEDDTIKFTVEI